MVSFMVSVTRVPCDSRSVWSVLRAIRVPYVFWYTGREFHVFSNLACVSVEKIICRRKIWVVFFMLVKFM